MRNMPIPFRKCNFTYGAIGRLRPGALVLGLLLVPWLGGCMDNPSRAIINRGYNEMYAARFDDADADADEFLRAHPNGVGSAEAWYLKGRIDEARAQNAKLSPTLAEKTKYLDRARDDYEEGLLKGPPVGIRAQLHTGIANVDYYEEDYTAALREWQSALDNLPSDDGKAWTLYSIGRCQQRLGMFVDADASFRDVQRFYPGSPAAGRAAVRIGMNAFYVEVAEFTDLTTAEQAASKLRKVGYTASRALDSGKQMVHVGPLPSFAEAKAVQSRLRHDYPTAVISP